MSGAVIRRQFLRDFRALRGDGDLYCLLTFASYVSQILGSIALGAYIVSLSLSLWSVVLIAMIAFFIGTRLRGLNNIVHECSHFAFAARRELNTIYGKICSSLIMKTFLDYREEHMSHHAHLGDYENDLDFQAIQRFRLEDPLTPSTILRHLVTPLTGVHIYYYARPSLSGRDGLPYRLLKLGLVAASLIFAIFMPLEALLFVFVPFFLVLPTINYWTDCIDHGGLVGSDDELFASRNVIVPLPLRFVVFPRNDCFHLIHHLFPQVPVRYFDACHKLLLQNAAYRQREGDTLSNVGAVMAAAGQGRSLANAAVSR